MSATIALKEMWEPTWRPIRWVYRDHANDIRNDHTVLVRTRRLRDAWIRLQSTQQEYCDQPSLFSRVKLQVEQKSNWKCQDDTIKQGFDNHDGQEEGLVMYASPLDVKVPEMLHWHACENLSKQARDPPQDRYDHDNSRRHFEAWNGEDAAIKSE